MAESIDIIITRRIYYSLRAYIMVRYRFSRITPAKVIDFNETRFANIYNFSLGAFFLRSDEKMRFKGVFFFSPVKTPRPLNSTVITADYRGALSFS